MLKSAKRIFMKFYNKIGNTVYRDLNFYFFQYVSSILCDNNSVLFFQRHITVLLLVTTSFFVGCYKLADVPPPSTSFTGESVYQEDGTAAAVMSGLYSNLQTDLGAGKLGISLRAGLSSDELDLVFSNDHQDLELFYLNSLSSNAYLDVIWSRCFSYLHTVNSLMEGVEKSGTLTPLVKQQLLGEARFVRAFVYFYLVNLYGDVPLLTTSNYLVASKLGRTDLDEVYALVIDDLKEAVSLLSNEYLAADCRSVSEDRVRPTKAAAHALLARVYLFRGDWGNAESQATEVIGNGAYQLVDLPNVFLKNNSEAIWQIMPVDPGYNTWEGRVFIADPGFGFEHPVAISESLVTSFEPNDARKDNWMKMEPFTGRYYPFKYKIGDNIPPPQLIDEYLNVIRLAELYLIRAEARIQHGNVPGGVKDINELRIRANRNAAESIPMLSENITKEQAMYGVEHERRVELFTEWGHRWLDLKRMKGVGNSSMTRADEVFQVVKGANWNAGDKLYPIPQSDIRLNPNLLPQNPEY